jgi:tetratricopeptide (TPR) repeat protein
VRPRLSSVDDFVKAAKLEIGEATREIELNPKNPSAYLRRATALRKLGDTPGEISDYDKAIEKHPDYTPAYLLRADAHSRLRKYGLALSDYTIAIELDPHKFNYYLLRGLVHHHMRSEQAAIDDYTKAIELSPNHASAYFFRGISYAEVEEYRLALCDFNKAIELKPDDGLAYATRGQTHLWLGMYQEAVDDSIKAVAIDAKAPVQDYLSKAYEGLREEIENMMEVVSVEGSTYRIGHHREQGLFVYDPRSQGDVAVSSIRLFVVEEKSMKTLTLDARLFVSVADSSSGAETIERPFGAKELEAAAGAYSMLRTNARFAHCYNCKKDLNSMDFSLCKACGWIRCSCGACGCEYHSRGGYGM